MSIIWSIILGLSVLISFMIADILFLGISVAALFSIILDFFKFSMEVQIIIFGLITILVIMIFYAKCKKNINKNKAQVKNLEERYIGMRFILANDISGEDLIAFKGSYWTFKNIAKELKAGDEVEIIGVEGNKLLIDKSNDKLEILTKE